MTSDLTALAEQAIDAIDSVYGRDDRYRAVHAKGVVCAGTFTATPEAAGLTRAAHMRGEPVKVTTRFSNGSGVPSAADHVQDGRGMSTKFYLPDGSRTDIVALSLPCFFVRTPEEFIEFTKAGKPLPLIGQPGPRLPWYLLRHREALPAVRAFLGLKPPVGYGRVRYNSLHSFKWVDAGGGERWVRYSWLPEAGESTIPTGEAKRLGPDYLRDEVAGTLQSGSVRFDLEVQIAGPDDRIDDPTAAWPADREKVTVGKLELTALDDERERDGDVLVFDPTRVTDGIELSGDEILRFRSYAYSVSIERRSGVARPAKLG